MPKKSTDRVKRKQARAREAGLCIVCFKAPVVGRAVCVACNDAAKLRVKASRARKAAS